MRRSSPPSCSEARAWRSCSRPSPTPSSRRCARTRRGKPRAPTTRSASSAASSAAQSSPRGSAARAATTRGRPSSTAPPPPRGGGQPCSPRVPAPRCSSQGVGGGRSWPWARRVRSGCRSPPEARGPLHLAREVEGGDAQTVAEVEAVGVAAVLAQARVEVQLGAARPARLGLQPGKEPVGVAAPAVPLRGDEVVDVEVPAPGEELADAEAGHGGRLPLVLVERPGEPGARRALALVDLADERLRAPERGPQLEQRAGGEGGLAASELADGHPRDARTA